MIRRGRLTIRFDSRTAAVGIALATATPAAPAAPLPRPVFPVGSIVACIRPRGPRPVGRIVIGHVAAAEIIIEPAFGGRQLPRVALIDGRLPAGADGIPVARPRRPVSVVVSAARLFVATRAALVTNTRCFGAVGRSAPAPAAPSAPAATRTILVALSLASFAGLAAAFPWQCVSGQFVDRRPPRRHRLFALGFGPAAGPLMAAVVVSTGLDPIPLRLGARRRGRPRWRGRAGRLGGGLDPEIGGQRIPVVGGGRRGGPLRSPRAGASRRL